GVLRPLDVILSLSRAVGHPWPTLRTPSQHPSPITIPPLGGGVASVALRWPLVSGPGHRTGQSGYATACPRDPGSPHNTTQPTVIPAHAGIQTRVVSGRRASGAYDSRQETDAVGGRPSRPWMAYGPTYEAGSRTGGRPTPNGSRLPREVTEGARRFRSEKPVDPRVRGDDGHSTWNTCRRYAR